MTMDQFFIDSLLMFSIAPYLVQVVDLKDIPQDLNNINNGTLVKYLEQYFASIRGAMNKASSNGGSQQRTFVYVDPYKGSVNSVAGYYKAGVYGHQSEIFNTSSKKTVHIRKKDEADLLPFHFNFYFPVTQNIADRTRGLLLLSRINNAGVRSIISPHLIESFSKAHPGLKLKIERFLPEKIVSNFTKDGSVKKIILVKNTLPKDLADAVSPNDYKKVQSMELIIKAKRYSKFDDVNWVMNRFKNGNSKFDPKAIFTLGDFTPDRVKVELTTGGRKRTIDMGNLHKIVAYVEIEKPTIGVGNLITPQCWLDEADELADDIFLSWDIQTPKWNSSV